MAIAKMKKFLLITPKDDIDGIMKKLQKLAIVEIEHAHDKTALHNSPTSEIQQRIEKNKQARGILSKYKKNAIPKQSPPDNLANSVIDLHTKITELQSSIKTAEKEVLKVLPYKDFDGSLSQEETQNTISELVFVNGAHTDEELQDMFPESYYKIISRDKSKTYLWVLYPKNLTLNPEFVQFKHQSEKTPSEYIKALRSKIEKNAQLIVEYQKKLTELAGYIDFLTDEELLKEKELLEEMHKLSTTDTTAVISGYTLKSQEKTLKKLFKKAYIEFMDPGEDAPTAFKNNFLVSPVEGITESYTMPSPQDIDPNPVMAFFYYLFFGMMFSDAGYGLLMMAVCGYVGFFTNSKIRKMMQMFFFCGISTLFWGLMYGSFFGNAITSVGETFFGRRLILRPLWINPTSEPLTLLIFSIALGFIQILTGLALRVYVQLRQGHIKTAVYDTGSWIVTLSGLGLLSAGIALKPLLNIGIVMTAAGVLMLILTQGRTKKNVFLKLTSGILSLYNITSYISDILSYSRLMALGLATGVIAQVVNILGALGGNTLAGIIMYIAVFIVGHGLNFAINMLGAYVHTNRLQYVEFYSKFYEGGGRAFTPFGRRYNT